MNIFFSSKRSAIAIAILLLIVAFFLGVVSKEIGNKVVSVVSQKRVPIYKVDVPDKRIAITIDGVWGAEKTPRILDIFDKHNVKITFFFGGYWLEKYPDMVREIISRGHEIGNHTYTHPHCNSLTPNQLKKELEQTSLLIQELTGKWPQFFRPPFGEYNNQVIRICEEENYQVIQWSIDSLDWKEPGVHFIVKRVLDNVGSGEIVLMHNNGKHTADALEILVPRLIEMGYKIVPLSQLVFRDNYYIETHSGVQKPIR